MPSSGYKQTEEHKRKIRKARGLDFARESIRFIARGVPILIEICPTKESITVSLYRVFSLTIGMELDDLKRIMVELEKRGIKGRRYHPRRKKITYKGLTPEQREMEQAKQYENRFEKLEEAKEEAKKQGGDKK